MGQKIVFIGVLALLSACSDRNAPPAAPATAREAAHASAEAAAAPGTDASASAPAASAQATIRSAATAPGALRADGVGPVRFGMRLAEAEQAAGGKASLPAPFDPACSMVRFASLPKLRFMVEQGVVTRADAEPGVENAVGIAVGDTLAQVQAAHPDAKLGAHKYDPSGHTITFPSADGRAAIIAEETGGKLTKVRAGLQPAVAYVETCG